MNKQGPPPPAGFMPPPSYTDGLPYAGGSPNVVVMHAPQLGPDPQTMTCPYCAATVTTNIETSPSMKTHLMALLLCLFACWPCAPCVYCVDSCMIKKHYCPSCHKFLGAYDN